MYKYSLISADLQPPISFPDVHGGQEPRPKTKISIRSVHYSTFTL